MLAGTLVLLVLVRCGALLEGGSGRGQWSFAGLCLVGAALAYSRFVSGACPGIDLSLERMDHWARRHEETPAQRNARHWCCSEAVAKTLQHLEQQVNMLMELGVGRRLEELERRERWRMQASTRSCGTSRELSWATLTRPRRCVRLAANGWRDALTRWTFWRGA